MEGGSGAQSTEFPATGDGGAGDFASLCEKGKKKRAKTEGMRPDPSRGNLMRVFPSQRITSASKSRAACALSGPLQLHAFCVLREEGALFSHFLRNNEKRAVFHERIY